ncbi:MAG: hypothetical protein HWE16_13350 [Gammaproteobacteria bacterium]|nr:hypothetical protein [Gammaproteobacteria bacterium]
MKHLYSKEITSTTHPYNKLFLDKFDITVCKKKPKAIEIITKIENNAKTLNLKILKANPKSGFDKQIFIPYGKLKRTVLYRGNKSKGIYIFYKSLESIGRIKSSKRFIKFSMNPYYWKFTNIKATDKVIQQLTGYPLRKFLKHSTVTNMHFAYDVPYLDIHTFNVRFKKAALYKVHFDAKGELLHYAIGGSRGAKLLTIYDKRRQLIEESDLNIEAARQQFQIPLVRIETKIKSNTKFKDIIHIKNPFKSFEYYGSTVLDDPNISWDIRNSIALRGIGVTLKHRTRYQAEKLIESLRAHKMNINADELWSMYLDALSVLNLISGKNELITF